jgi:hypothetical protein
MTRVLTRRNGSEIQLVDNITHVDTTFYQPFSSLVSSGSQVISCLTAVYVYTLCQDCAFSYEFKPRNVI